MVLGGGQKAPLALASLGDDGVFGWHGIVPRKSGGPGFDLEPPGS
jgi:hypothetical protein